MSEIRVDLVTPSGMMLKGTVLPGDMIVAEAVEALVGELRLPAVSSAGTEIQYRLDRPKYGPCRPTSTLREAGVSDGERVHLVAVERPRRRQPSPGASVPTPGDDLEVQLVLLDQNVAEVARLDPNRPAGELVREIVRRHNLAFRDELDEPITYRVESQALGRYLADRETLGSAGVAPGDRLVVHRQEHAG